MQPSNQYAEHFFAGPFKGQIDPWAESGRYFQQIHPEIISHLLGQLRLPLFTMGYFAGRETSLQIADQSKPDIFVRNVSLSPFESHDWNYSYAAETALAEPGLILEDLEPELDALVIKEIESGQLVTVVEIVSPRNKTNLNDIEDYRTRRARLLHRAVNVVEIDLTRSVKRLSPSPLVDSYSYHVAVHMWDNPPRLIGMEFGDALKRCALPLRAEVIAIELQAAYDHAYQQTTIAGHILNETDYAESALPFPSLLTPQQIHNALEKAQTWRETLRRLQQK